MQLFEEYPPSLVLYAVVAVVVTLTINPLCGFGIVAVAYMGHRLDTH